MHWLALAASSRAASSRATAPPDLRPPCCPMLCAQAASELARPIRRSAMLLAGLASAVRARGSFGCPEQGPGGEGAIWPPCTSLYSD